MVNARSRMVRGGPARPNNASVTSLGLSGLFFAVRRKVPDVDVREPFASWLELPRRDSLTGDTEVIRLEPLPYEVPPLKLRAIISIITRRGLMTVVCPARPAKNPDCPDHQAGHASSTTARAAARFGGLSRLSRQIFRVKGEKWQTHSVPATQPKRLPIAKRGNERGNNIPV